MNRKEQKSNNPDRSLSKAKKVVNKYRFSLDTTDDLSTNISYSLDIIEDNLVRNSVQINEKISPKLELTINDVCEKLEIDRGLFAAFVSSSSEIQAYCYSTNNGDCIIQLTSGIVNLLSLNELKFIIGHELGHFLLGHGVVHKNENEINLYGKKYQEISADRIGAFVVDDINDAYRSLIKTASGLGDDVLRFDITAFLQQLEVANKNLGEDMRNTHPSILIRAKAVSWFSLLLENYSESQKKKIDLNIERDIEEYLNGPRRFHKQKIEET